MCIDVRIQHARYTRLFQGWNLQGKKIAISVHIRVLRIYACFSRRPENQPPVSEIVFCDVKGAPSPF